MGSSPLRERMVRSWPHLTGRDLGYPVRSFMDGPMEWRFYGSSTIFERLNQLRSVALEWKPV